MLFPILHTNIELFVCLRDQQGKTDCPDIPDREERL